MTDLDALLAGIVADPHEAVRWLIVADWLDDHGQTDRAELLRLHRMLIDTCCEPDAHPERAAWQSRIVELIDQGVKPCVPQHTLKLPGGVPLVGNFIPPGTFLMGGMWEPWEQPIHAVTLTRGFFVGTCPVTQEQWQAAMGDNPSQHQGDIQPVTNVNWADARHFCERVGRFTSSNLRLPTEAEWEYACRAGTTTQFHYGDEWSETRMNWDELIGTTDVCSFSPNPWWLYDCHGNVFEWCSDWYEDRYYHRSPAEDPICRDGSQSYRAVRGGAFGIPPHGCRSASRGWDDPKDRLPTLGFRVAFTLT